MKKTVIVMLSGLAGVIGGILAVGQALSKQIEESEKVLSKQIEETEQQQNLSGKLNRLFLLMNQWVKIKQEGFDIATYFINQNYNKIAIYGMSYVGETLLSELKNSTVKVSYAIDKNAFNLCSEIDIFMPNDELAPVDVIVVTAVCFYDEIKTDLEKRFKCPIVSLENIIHGMQLKL